MSEVVKVIGLMSGTSLDGIDAALIETDGEQMVRPGPALTIPYDAQFRDLLRAAIDDAPGVPGGGGTGEGPLPPSIREAERLSSEAHARAVQALLAKADLSAADIALVGFHGQTILHRPALRQTWQIGDGALLARLTGIDVVNRFRHADVAAGGQGAPLMPLYHAALASGSALPKPLVVVNIGGVGNVTYIDGASVQAFDSGPGNAPLDDWMQRHTATALDAGGALARTGRIDDAALTAMLAHAFFDRVPPKSLDRQDFGMDAVEGLSAADGAATLAAFTAATIARAAEHFPRTPMTWIICGGGRHNDFLMDQLRARLPGNVLKAEGARWDGDALEAEGFAYLALRAVKGLPLSLPTTTGVPVPMTGGELHRH